VGVTDAQVESENPATLLARAQAGQAEAFCVLAEGHQARLLRQALVLSREMALAEDLVAETLIEAWKCLDRFNGSCRLSTWLYAILVHRFQKAVRRCRSRPIAWSSLPRAEAEEGAGFMAQMADDRPLPDELLLRDERSARFLSAIAALPEKHQPVILLRFFEAASLAEIASALHVSVGTVKSRLHHALDKLRRRPDVVNLLRETRDL
jgi:RNA polymerase sigma-70 factor (ECF subfamily)